MEHKILVAIPTLGQVRTELFQRLADDYWNDRRVVVRAISNVQDVAAARNELVLYHYDYEAFTRLVLIDADTVPPPRFLDRMLEVNRPVVSGVTHIFKPYKPHVGGPEVRWALWKRRIQKDGTDTYDNVKEIQSSGLLEEEGLATGCFCMMIQSEVLQRLSVKLPFFKTEYNEETQEKTRSEDIYFCGRVERELGIRISILTDLICGHYKTTNLEQIQLLVEKTQR